MHRREPYPATGPSQPCTTHMLIVFRLAWLVTVNPQHDTRNGRPPYKVRPAESTVQPIFTSGCSRPLTTARTVREHVARGVRKYRKQTENSWMKRRCGTGMTRAKRRKSSSRSRSTLTTSDRSYPQVRITRQRALHDSG